MKILRVLATLHCFEDASIEVTCEQRAEKSAEQALLVFIFDHLKSNEFNLEISKYTSIYFQQIRIMVS